MDLQHSLKGRYHCPECGSTFTRLQNLQRHRRNHAGLKPHKCSQCGEQFARTDLVRRHQQQCHDGFLPATAPRACRSCSSSKVRCDRQSPCFQCQTKGIICESQDSRPDHPWNRQKARPKPSNTSKPNPTSESISSFTSTASPIVVSPVSDSLIFSPSIDWLQGLDDLFNNTYSTSPYGLTSNTIENSSEKAFDQTPGDSPVDFPMFNMDMDIPSLASSSSGSPSESSISSNSSAPSSAMASPTLCPTLEMLTSVYWPTTPDSKPSLSTSLRVKPDDLNIATANNALPAVTTCRNEPSSFFTPSMLAYFPRLYLKHFNPHWPIFDPSLFNLTEVYPPLSVAICCIGAIYSGQAASKRLATAIMLVQRPSLISKLATHRLNDHERLSTLHALFLYQVMGSFHPEEHHRSLAKMFHGSLVQLLRQSGLLQRNDLKATPQTDETRRRVVFGIYFLDTLQPILNGSPALLSLNEMMLQIPLGSSTSLFHPHPAPQASLSLFSLFRQLLDPRKKARCPDKFTALLLLLALLGQVFDFLRLRHSTLASCSEMQEIEGDDDSALQTRDAVSESFKVRQHSLEATLRRWKLIWDALDDRNTGITQVVYENAMPIHMIIFSALSFSDSNTAWGPSIAGVQPGNNGYKSSVMPDFAQFCNSFRSYINEADWCGVQWMFPPLEEVDL